MASPNLEIIQQATKASKKRETNKAAASGFIGSTLEYYDFFIYAMAASFIFPKLFFPESNPTLGIVASLATYGVGYVSRPIGAFFLGHFGDRYGRKNVLLLCMFLMGVSTIIVGLLPTYAQIGIFAPILLVILRLIQGFAVAGEMSGAGSLIVEHAPEGKRGFYASFAQLGTSFGQLLAALVFIPFSYFLPHSAFMSFGWRIPFLLSVFVLIAGFIIRRYVNEPKIFIDGEEQGKKTKAPIIEAVHYHWRDMLKVTFMSLNNIVPVTITVFGAAYATQEAYGINISADSFLWITVLANIIAVIVTPFMGMISDKFGRRPIAIIGLLGSGFFCIVFLKALGQGDLTMAILYAFIGWGIIYQGFNAVYPSFYPELFPAHIRVSAVAISNNIGVPVASLLASFFAFIAPPGSENIPLKIGLLSFAITCVAALSAFLCRETYKVSMKNLGKKDPEKHNILYNEAQNLSASKQTNLNKGM